jgi:hypothetical protein
VSHDPRRDGSPHDRSDAHERARTLLAERLTEQIDAADVAWLEEHLAGCEPCRAVDAEYRVDRRELRILTAPEPPRDLWARTSAALDAERRRHPRRDEVVARGSRSSAGARSVRLTPPIALGIAAVIVGAFVVGSQLGPAAQAPGFALGSPATTTVPSQLAGLATPIAVAGGDVAWSVRAADGTYTLQEAPVNQVCPTGAAADCPPLDIHRQGVAAIPVTPKSVYASSAMHQFVVLGNQAGSNGTGLYVVSVGAPMASASPTPSVRPSAPASPAATTSPAATATPEPSTSPAASGSATPSPSSTTRPSATPATSPSGTEAPASAAPTPSTPASAEPTASVAPVSLPPGTPAPTAAAVLAIASNLTVLGVTAAYSPDGSWFAFTARDSAAGSGSDIYLWHVGEGHAIAATTDHRSVYAGWADGRIVGSRAASTGNASASPSASGHSADASAAPNPSDRPQAAPTSFLLDPASLHATDLATSAWRPVVDPTGMYAVYWSGTVVPDPATGGWTTGSGRLVLAPWSALSGSTATSSAKPSATDVSTVSTPAANAPPRVTPIALPTDVESAAGVEWDAHWDETGSHLGIWVADRADPSLGHLDLVTIDRRTGLADPAGPSLRSRPALAGFALGSGHLAWATPPGQDGQGSTLQVFAWSGPHAGQISSQAAGGSDPVIVVQH